MTKQKNSPMKQQPYNEIKKDWDQILENFGFKDIEDSQGRLKHWHSVYFFMPSHGFVDKEKFFGKRDYYLRATEFLNHGKFKSVTERQIWALHSEGKSTYEIPTILSVGRGIVWRTIERIRSEMFAFMSKEIPKEQVLKIRPRTEADDAFIFHSFLSTIYHAGHWRATRPINGKKLPYMTKETVWKYATVLKVILSKPNVTAQVCCLKDDESVIVGYSIFEDMVTDTILHWVYVREDWQHEGIARDLCPKTFTVITHLTADGRSVLNHLANKGVRPKLISLPIAYEILENTFKPRISEVPEVYEGEKTDVRT